MVEPGALEFESSDKIIPLVFTSPDSGTQPRSGYENHSPSEIAGSFQSDKKIRHIALAINGPFISGFSETKNVIKTESEVAIHLTRSTGEPVVFVIADVDWLFDPFSLQRINVSGRTIVRPLNDNLSFLLNLVEYASGNNNLSLIRSRGRLQRPFTKVQMLFQKVNDEFRTKENVLASKVREIEIAMTSKLKAAGESSAAKHSRVTTQEIQNFRQILVEARLRLRETRRLMRKEVEDLGRVVGILNTTLGPTLVLMLWMLTILFRRRKLKN